MPRSKKEKVKASNDITCPEWMLTMGDAMSLLLTFFVLLLTFSTIDEHRLMDAMGFVQGALGAVHIEAIRQTRSPGRGQISRNDVELVDKGTATSSSIASEELSPVLLDSVEIQGRFFEMERKLRALGMKNVVDLDIVESGVCIRIPRDQLFRGDGELAATAERVLQGVANLAADVGNELRLTSCISVEGNDTRFADGAQWSRAMRQSMAVGDCLIREFELPASRLGYSTRVLSAGDTNTFEIRIMEKLGVQEVSLKQLWKDSGRSAPGG